MEADEKPLKLGELWMMTTSGFKKIFKQRFLILTNKEQVIWYRKQEDHMEGKRGGTIKKLAQCSLEESGTRTLPSGVEVFCFTIQASNKTLLGVEAERDRLNWIVEILKFRGIGGLIEIVNDPQQKLRRHAAYALCNLAGRSRDDSQTRIVRENGVHCLLEYQKTLEEADLIDSINYALCKLSSQEDNKVVLAMNMEHLFGLVQSANERWNEFGLETLRNCSTHPDVKKKILDFGGIEILVGNTLCKKEVMKEKSLVLAAECLSNCAENDACKTLITANIPLLAVALPAFPPKAQEQAIRLLTQCMIQDDNTVTCLSDIVPTLVPLIVSPVETLQEVVLYLFSKLTKTEPHLTALRSPSCLANLLVTISSANVNIVLYSLGILLDCWCNENQVTELAQVESEQLCGFVPLLSHEDHNIIGETIKILDCLVTHDASLEEISRERVFIKSLLPALLQVQTSQNSHGLPALACVKKLSRNNFVKLILCEKVLLKEMVTQLTDAPDNHQLALYNLTAFRHCASLALAKVYLSELGCLEVLHRYLNTTEELKQESCELLALLLRASQVRASADALAATVVTLLTPENSPTVHALACRALRNWAFDRAKSLPANTVSALLSVISSKDTAVVESALSALLNMRFESACSLALSPEHLPPLLQCIEHSQDSVRITATKLMAAIVAEASPEVKERVCDASLLPKIQNNMSKGLNLALVSVQLIEELLSSEGFCKRLAASEVLSQVFSAFQKTKDLPYLAGCLSILSTAGPYLQKERKRDFLGSECMTRCCRLLHFVSPVILCHATQLLLQCMTFGMYLRPDKSPGTLSDGGAEGNKQLIMKPAQQKLVQLTFYPREDIRQAASQTLLRLKQDGDGKLVVDHVRVLKSLINSWTGTAGTPRGVSIRLEEATARMVSDRKDILVTEYESPQILQQNIARAFFVTDSTVIPEHTSPLEQTRENTKSKGRRTARTDEGSPNFLANMGKRKRSAHSAQNSNSSARRDSFSSVVQAHGRKQCKLFAYQGYSLVEYRARVDPSFAAQKGSVSHLFELEIPSHVGPMEVLSSPPADFSLHHVPADDSILKISSDPLLVEHVTVSPTEYPLIEAVQIIQEVQMNTSFRYFELHIVAAGPHAAIGIGMATETMALDEQPGWVDDSYGYHGDDGNFYWKSGGNVQHTAFGPPFQTGDTVGCGWNNVTGELFFTHNGKLISPPEVLPVNVLESTKCFRPTVCLSSAGEKVYLNVGQNPFLWNWDLGNVIQGSPAPRAEYDAERPPSTENEYLSGLSLLMNQHKFSFFAPSNQAQ